MRRLRTWERGLPDRNGRTSCPRSQVFIHRGFGVDPAERCAPRSFAKIGSIFEIEPIYSRY
ncbi:MAG: hypothetical protein M5U34_20515 [Chloroflexi bacterium]|nr:hypothetical protein [Chloroflexota bacterium]